MNKTSRWLFVIGFLIVFISWLFTGGRGYVFSLNSRNIFALALGCLCIISAVCYTYFGENILSGAQKINELIEQHPISRWWEKKQFIESDQTVKSKYINRVALLWSPVVLTVYLWFASAGQWSSLPRTTNYYDQLANAFSKGHLYLDALPAPLEKIPKPIDYSLYKGKYYLYFGPTPALFLAVIKVIHHAQIGDSFITVIWLSGSYIFQALLILSIWKNFFWKLPVWTAIISLPLIGLFNPIIYMLVTARVYESAIAAGQFFLMGGLYFAFVAFNRTPLYTPPLFLAGLFFAFTIGSRLSLIMSVGYASLMIVLCAVHWLHAEHKSRIIKALLSFCLPIGLGILLLGLYNYARFESSLESGFSYQSMGMKMKKFHTDQFAIVYFPQNVYNYFLNPPRNLVGFPFFSSTGLNKISIISFVNLPDTYTGEQITGMVYSSPFLLFSVISILLLFSNKDFLRARFFKSIDFTGWLTLSLTGVILLAFGPLLLFFWATMRYTMDFMPSLVLLSMIGLWQGYSLLTTNLQRIFYSFAAICLAGISVLMSFSLGFSINLWWIEYFRKI